MGHVERGGGQLCIVVSQGRDRRLGDGSHGTSPRCGGWVWVLHRWPGGPVLLRTWRQLGSTRAETGGHADSREHRQAIGAAAAQGGDQKEAVAEPVRSEVEGNRG